MRAKRGSQAYIIYIRIHWKNDTHIYPSNGQVTWMQNLRQTYQLLSFGPRCWFDRPQHTTRTRSDTCGAVQCCVVPFLMLRDALDARDASDARTVVHAFPSHLRHLHHLRNGRGAKMCQAHGSSGHSGLLGLVDSNFQKVAVPQWRLMSPDDHSNVVDDVSLHCLHCLHCLSVAQLAQLLLWRRQPQLRFATEVKSLLRSWWPAVARPSILATLMTVVTRWWPGSC